jgi:hypothetical protein
MKAARITLYGDQRTDDWFDVRCGKITMSNAQCVMAKAKVKKDGTESTAASSEATTRMNYRVRVALEQVTGIPDREEAFKTIEMKRGEEREPLAAMHYEIETGNEIEPVKFVYLEGLAIGCSPDGLVGKTGMIETKSGNRATHLEYMQRTTVPPEYHWQVQGSLWVCEREWCDFLSFHPDFPPELQLNVLRVWRDDDAIKELVAGCGRFLLDVAKTRELIETLMAERRQLKEAA